MKDPTEWSKSYNKSPVALNPGTALCNERSLDTAECRCRKSPLAGGNNESIQLEPTVPCGTCVPSTIKASTFGPALAGAMKRSCPWNLSSHLVVPPSDMSALNVKVVLVLEAVAFTLNSKVVELVILDIVAPLGIPVPDTDIPTTNSAVLSIVTVASPLVVSQVESLLVPCFAYNQSPKASTPSLSCFATIDNSLSYDTTKNADEYTPCG